jgi:hypothetical protein
MHVIAYDIPADYTDEYLHTVEDRTIQSVWMFANTLIRLFGPVIFDLQMKRIQKKLMAMNEKERLARHAREC